ncbi:MAG: response regulator [Ekhidna sp.]|uniref:response regulator n=1 Tax=Ekhidna sp. TaxID=2608089 RepID=UPI0032EFAD6F
MKKTILFVDDELINLFVLEKRFEAEYNVLTAESGEDALKRIEENKETIDAIISDLKMAEMDGLQLIDRVKPDIVDVPCFLLTGYDYNDQINAAISSKKVDFLFKKPFDYNLIDSKLKETLGDG